MKNSIVQAMHLVAASVSEREVKNGFTGAHP